jgi:fucose permease
VAVAALAYGSLVDERPTRADRDNVSAGLAWPTADVLAIGTIAAFAAIVEGGVADWSGLYLQQSLGSPADRAPAGFAAFSVTMMIARFAGDRFIDRVGRRALLRWGPLLTAFALGTALLLPSVPIAIAAFALAGLGMATVFPIAFGEAGAVSHRPGHAIAAVATMAYGAGLLGPPAIGFVADLTSLPRALGTLVLACLIIVLLARPHAGADRGPPIAGDQQHAK